MSVGSCFFVGGGGIAECGFGIAEWVEMWGGGEALVVGL